MRLIRALEWRRHETVYHLGMIDHASIVDALERAGYRITAPRRTVAELVADRDGHFTAADLVTGEHAYVACEPAHHHHVVCSSCGRAAAVGIDDGRLAAVVRDVTRQTGYRVDSHRIELFGLCPACRTAA
jgi:Fe2+ or Zn2+ uptake regulation protein